MNFTIQKLLIESTPMINFIEGCAIRGTLDF
jgi:hypothetical protein